jgi:hypothetical protein
MEGIAAGCVESRHEGENFLQTVLLCHSQWSPYSIGQAFNKLVQNIHTTPKLFHNFSLNYPPTIPRVATHKHYDSQYSRKNVQMTEPHSLSTVVTTSTTRFLHLGRFHPFTGHEGP